MSKGGIIYGILGTAATVLIVVLIKHAAKKTGWQAPVKGKISSGFGLRKDPLNPAVTSGHNGVDVPVPIGTPVKAPMDGLIISTASSTDGGNQVIMVHDGKGPYQNWKSGFAHNSKITVKVGDRVKAGQTIALSGNTGARTTGPHSHITLRNSKGEFVDPAIYLYGKA